MKQLFTREHRYVNTLNEAIRAGYPFNVYRTEGGAIKTYLITEMIVNIYTGAMSVAITKSGLRTSEPATEQDLKVISSQARLYQSREQHQKAH